MTSERRPISAASVQQLVDAHKMLRCWGAHRGHGTFLVFDMGDSIPRHHRDGSEYFTGSYHLWVYLASWQISGGGQVLARSTDDPPTIDRALPRFETACLLGISEQPRPAVTFLFTHDLELELNPTVGEISDDLFMLFF